MNRFFLKGIIIISCILILLSVGIYVCKFWGQSLSSDTGDWGAFSDYLNPFIAVINLLVIGWLSFSVYHYNLIRDRQNDIFQKNLERPVIVSKSTFVIDRNPKEIWEIRNIGNGVALNLKITYKSNRQENIKTPIIKTFSLGKGESLILSWIHWVDLIFIVYEDLFSNEYITICGDDESFTQPLTDEFENIVLNNATITKEYIVKIKNLNQERLHWATLYGANQIVDGGF